MREKPIQQERELSPFEKMRQLAAKVVSTPKDEVDRRQEEWRKDRDKRKAEPTVKADSA